MNGLSALGDAAYSVGKAGMISLTKSLAVEFGRHGIRTNIVCPGTVRTPIWDHRVGAQSRCPRRAAQVVSARPDRRADRGQQVVAFLASDAASAITGVVLPVDCGLTAGNIVMARELTLEDL